MGEFIPGRNSQALTIFICSYCSQTQDFICCKFQFMDCKKEYTGRYKYIRRVFRTQSCLTGFGYASEYSRFQFANGNTQARLNIPYLYLKFMSKIIGYIYRSMLYGLDFFIFCFWFTNFSTKYFQQNFNEKPLPKTNKTS